MWLTQSTYFTKSRTLAWALLDVFRASKSGDAGHLLPRLPRLTSIKSIKDVKDEAMRFTDGTHVATFAWVWRGGCGAVFLERITLAIPAIWSPQKSVYVLLALCFACLAPRRRQQAPRTSGEEVLVAGRIWG